MALCVGPECRAIADLAKPAVLEVEYDYHPGHPPPPPSPDGDPADDGTPAELTVLAVRPFDHMFLRNEDESVTVLLAAQSDILPMLADETLGRIEDGVLKELARGVGESRLERYLELRQ